MEKILRENDNKPPYQECSTNYLITRFAVEYQEYWDEIKPWGNVLSSGEIVITDAAAKEIIDMLNFGMMILTKWEGFDKINLGLDVD